MKKSTITANLIVSCICLAISLPLCCLGGCFGVIIFGFSLYCVINYTIKLATFDESKVVDNQDLDIWHKRFSVAWVAAGAVVLCIILVIIDFSPKSKSNKKTEESEIQTTERQLRESPDISVAQNLEIGQTVTIDDITVTVNAIKENPENYVINITYENNSGDDFKASLFDWEIGTDGSYDTYISDESNFRATFVKSGKKLKGSLLMPKNQNAEKIKFSSGFINYNYESDIYATWDIPEKSINTTETTTVTTSTKTTQTTITTTEPVQFELTQLYLDFFEPYVDSVSKLSPQKFSQDNSEKFADYDVDITEGNENDLWTFSISDKSGNKVYMCFYPENDMYKTPPEDWVWTLCLLTYNNGDKEISISDNFHLYSTPKYNTNDKNREPIGQEIKSVDELKKFIFEVKKPSTTNTTVTTTEATKPSTTEKPAEPPTEPPTPVPTNPPTSPLAEPKVIKFILNTESNCVHINSGCSAAEKILTENYAEIEISEDELANYAYTYWACGKCSKRYSNDLPKITD